MAFLRLNGVTIPVSVKGGSNTIQERSMRLRSHAGDYRTDTLTSNRRYQFTTTPLTEMEALALGGLINGDGDILTFDDTTATSKGLDASGSVTIAYSTTIPTGFTGKSGTVSDGGEVYDLGIGTVKANQDLTINLWTNTQSAYPIGNISAATQANPCVLTVTGHPFNDNDKVYIKNVVGMTQLNGNTYTVANKTSNTFQLSAVNSTGYGAYESGGTAGRPLPYLFNFSDKTATYKNSARAYRTDDGKLNFKVSASDSTGSDPSVTANKTSLLELANPFNGSWKMLTFVVRRNAESGEYNQYMYVNAVLQVYATTAHTPTPSAWNEWVISSDGSTSNEWENKLDDFQILPYAATADMVSGWYNFGQNVGLHPKLKMDGDVTRDTIVDVVGRVTKKKYIHASGATKQILTFELVETA